MEVSVVVREGFHLGASWKFTDEPIVIGSDPSVPVYLSDPTVPPTLLRVVPKGAWVELHDLAAGAVVRMLDGSRVPRRILSGMSVQVQLDEVLLVLGVTGESSHASVASRPSIAWKKLLKPKQWPDFWDSLNAQQKFVAFFCVLFSGLVTINVLLKTETQVISPVRAESNNTAQLMFDAARSEVEQFRKGVKAEKFEVTASTNHIQIDAQLSRKEIADFEAMLASITQDYGKVVRISANVSLSEEQKRIDDMQIEQIILGSNPVVILRDGERLFMGAELDGIVLQSVTADKVVFQGLNTYELQL